MTVNKETTTTVRLDRKLAEAVRKIAENENRPMKAQLDLLVKFAIFYGCAPLVRRTPTHAQKWLAKRKEVPHEGSLGTKQKGRSLTK